MSSRAKSEALRTLLCIALASCTEPRETGTDASVYDASLGHDGASDVRPGPMMVQTDAEIAAVTDEINRRAIEHGRLAQMRAVNVEVRAYADRMVHEYEQVGGELEAVLSRARITRQQSIVSETLAQNTDMTSANLRAVDGPAFDEAYMSSEEAMQANVLALLDSSLVPTAQNAELARVLAALRTRVNGHVADAQRIHANLRE